MNQLITYNNLHEGHTARRYTGFPLNSTLVSSYTPDTIRSIINHAAAGKPYTTAVWIRISRVGVQISAQDPQIARTRIPVFIPISLVNDIFMQPSITNVICIVYDEVKSNMKGVLLYVVHPTDAHLLRDDFRIVKHSTYSKGNNNNNNENQQNISDTNSNDNNRIFSPTSQHSNDLQRNGKTPRQQSPKRILYVRDNREITPPTLPQLNYTPYKGSYHSSRDGSAHRRHKSPRKPKSGQSSSKTGSDNGSKHRHKYRSRSPQKQTKTQASVDNNSEDLTQEKTNQQQQQEQLLIQQQQQQQQQQIAAWQATQQMPTIPGVYNRYVPKTIPLPSGETIKTTISPTNINGTSVGHIEQQNGTKGRSSTRSPSRSRSISPKRQDQHRRNRPLSAQNGDASSTLQTSNHHHHHHHHRRHHHTNGHNHSSSKPDTSIYNTISHSSRTLSKYLSTANNNNNNNNNDQDNETKQYLKQLIEDMQAMKLEMNKIRIASSSIGTTRPRSDSLRVNLKELRHDIDAIRARMAMTSRVVKA